MAIANDEQDQLAAENTRLRAALALKSTELEKAQSTIAEQAAAIASLTEKYQAAQDELLSIVVDGKLRGRCGQATSANTPSMNLVPATTWGMNWKPSSLRQDFSACRHSLKTIAKVA